MPDVEGTGMSGSDPLSSNALSVEWVDAEVERALDGGMLPPTGRFVLSVLSGAIPLIGGIFSGAAGTGRKGIKRISTGYSLTG